MDGCKSVRSMNRRTKLFKPLPNVRTRLLYVDDGTVDKVTDDVREAVCKSRTELRFSHKCETDLVWPADSSVIQPLKAERRKLWNEEIM